MFISNAVNFEVDKMISFVSVKADKIAEMTKAEREKQEQQTREDELREMGIKLRKR